MTIKEFLRELLDFTGAIVAGALCYIAAAWLAQVLS